MNSENNSLNNATLGCESYCVSVSLSLDNPALGIHISTVKQFPDCIGQVTLYASDTFGDFLVDYVKQVTFLHSDLIKQVAMLGKSTSTQISDLGIFKWLLCYYCIVRFILEYIQLNRPHTVMLLYTVQANVMMEYSIDEACSLLTKNLASAKKTLAQVQEDLNFIRDQTTTTEVSILWSEVCVCVCVCVCV